MSETKRPGSGSTDQADGGRLRYEPPRIAWREPYEPVASAISCAKEPGNPGCISGPTST